MTRTQDSAKRRFAEGFNCAQSVFAAYADEHETASELALRLAAPFGGGMGRAGQVCGALTGALMVLGLQYGTDHPEDKEEMYRITREFMAQFEQRHGSVLCHELVGFEIGTPEGLQAARAHEAFAQTCPMLVDQTAKALEQFLSEHPKA